MSDTATENSTTLRFFADWLDAGGARVGQIAILPRGTDGDGRAKYRLCHRDDADEAQNATPATLERYHRAGDALEISKSNARGDYRPLKSSPDLRRGWYLALTGAAAVREALDFFHPAMIGSFFRHRDGALRTVPLRQTLERQTGMYRFARNISPAGAQALIREHCDSTRGCLKKILWPVSADEPIASLPPEKLDPAAVAACEMPLLCNEACHLLVAGARLAAKREAAAASEGDS